LADVRSDDLAAIAVKAAVERSAIDPARIDDVILGCTNQAGEDNRNVARMARCCRPADRCGRTDGESIVRLRVAGRGQAAQGDQGE
jgi:hypothetical protein